MNPATVHSNQDAPNQAPATVVRRVIETLNSLEAKTADHLNALSFVLMRVARADGRVCNDERHEMEEILIEHARVPAEHAVLVTEIACHRTQLADCGSAYSISRGLRSRLDAAQRESIAGLLTAVARADGCFCALEHHEIAQIAGEIGIDPAEVLDRG
jgi:uncharacterized tellurite resistance protein B-like protein